MQKKIFQKIPSIILTLIFCLMIIITVFHLLDYEVIAQDERNWQIIIELYPETPAKNQEVLLLVFVEDNNGMPVPNLPLNITLNNLMSLPEERDFQFLTDPNPITNEKGEYKIIFNAPTLEWHRDGVYEIIVKIKLNDGSILSNSKEFKVQEKVFDTQNDNEPESAAPGAWYKIIFYDIDFKPITVSTSQNGVTQTKTWKIDDWESGGGMYEHKGKVEKKTVYEIHYIEDEFNALFRLDGDTQSLINMEGYPDKTLIYKFLVTEIQNNNITVSFIIYIDGLQTTKLIEIPTVPLYRPTYGLTDRLGQWFFLTHFDSDPPWGTRQNDDLLIYGIGFNGNVKLEIYNRTNIVHVENKLSQNYVTLYKWHVPINITDGKYSLVLAGNDINNEYFEKKLAIVEVILIITLKFLMIVE